MSFFLDGVLTVVLVQACDEAFDRLNNQPLQDGLMDIAFAWDPASDSTEPRRFVRFCRIKTRIVTVY
jgi:hypothetical protein